MKSLPVKASSRKAELLPTNLGKKVRTPKSEASPSSISLIENTLNSQRSTNLWWNIWCQFRRSSPFLLRYIAYECPQWQANDIRICWEDALEIPLSFVQGRWHYGLDLSLSIELPSPPLWVKIYVISFRSIPEVKYLPSPSSMTTLAVWCVFSFFIKLPTYEKIVILRALNFLGRYRVILIMVP